MITSQFLCIISVGGVRAFLLHASPPLHRMKNPRIYRFASSRNTIASSSSSWKPFKFSLDADGSAAAADADVSFRRGDKVQVEVVRFGRLGASVSIVGHGSHEEQDMISEQDEPLATGLILQREIQYFRAARDGLDVVLGEILPAYVENVRLEDGKLDISLRVPGGKGKAEDLAKIVLDKLQASKNGRLNIGDKSSPEDINRVLPGTSKASFKRAIASLYKQGLVEPGDEVTRLV